MGPKPGLQIIEDRIIFAPAGIQISNRPARSLLCVPTTIAPLPEGSAKIYFFNCKIQIQHGGTLLVAQLVEALRYKSERSGFDSR